MMIPKFQESKSTKTIKADVSNVELVTKYINFVKESLSEAKTSQVKLKGKLKFRYLALSGEIKDNYVIDKSVLEIRSFLNRPESIKKLIEENNKEYVDNHIMMIEALISKIEELQNQIDFLESVPRRKKAVTAIINAYNVLVIDEMIKNGYEYKMPLLGNFVIVRKKVTKPLKDWGSSFKLKKKIIDNGEIPYSKKNPEGKKWFVYFDWDYVPYVWWRKATSSKSLPNKDVYRFEPTKGETGVVPKLFGYIRANKKVLQKYQIQFKKIKK